MSDRRGFLGSFLSSFLTLPLLRSSPGQASGARPGEAAWPEDSDPAYWTKLRGQWDLREDEVFLNTATLGAPPRVVVEAMTKSVRDLTATLAEWDYKPGRPNWFTGYDPEMRLRTRLAKLLGCDVTELSLTQNATMGMDTVAMGLDLAAGDEVIQSDQEHPGGTSGWKVREKRHGIVVKNVAVPVPPRSPEDVLERIAAAITPRTRVIAWPHITSGYGVVHPVKEIAALAREKGLVSVFDGAQAIGHVDVDLHAIGCDAYFGSPHKWLLAPAGNGFLYVKKDFAPKVWTLLASSEWANAADPGFRLMQRGTGSLPLLVGLEAAIDFHERVGPARWRARIRSLGDRLRKGLTEIPGVTIASATHPDMAAGITTFRVAGKSPADLQDSFWEKARVRPRAVGEGVGVRTSTAVYNSEAEVDRLLQLVREAAGGSPRPSAGALRPPHPPETGASAPPSPPRSSV